MIRLDTIYTPAQLDAFEPAPFLAELRAELIALTSIEERGRGLRDAASAIDLFASAAARIRLDVAGTSLAMPLRRTLVATVTSYDGRLDLLRSRVPTADADAVERVFERVLADRAALRDGVGAIARELAALDLPVARAAARDARLEDAERDRWRAIVADLETFLGVPPEPEPEPEPEPTREELIELD